MIDFRYHVVSIIAVFLALGTGIVLGSTALDRPIIDDLKRRTEGLAQDKEEQQQQILDLRSDAADDQAFATAIAGIVLPGRLTGQRVSVVMAPTASKDVRDSLVAAVRQAGGRVSAQIRLLPRLVDPAAEAEIDELVNKLPIGIDPPSGTVPRAAAKLAAVLDADGAEDGPQAPATTVSVVSGYREAGLIAVDGGEVRPGDLVLFVLGPPEKDRLAASPSATGPDPLLDVITAFAGRGAVVLAAPPLGADDRSILNAVRDNAALAARLSSVDGAGTPAGGVVTVLSLADAVRREFGHYGTGPGATAPLPTTEPAAA